MNKTAGIRNLTHEEEIELLSQAKKSKTQQEREKATRLLIHYNRPFVKYIVGGYYHHLQSGIINPDDLVIEGDIAMLQAIKEFDLSRAEKYRLASYAGYWIHQRIRSFIKKSQFLPQATQKKPVPSLEEEDDLSGEKKQIPRKRSWGIIYYDREYHGTEKDDKITSLLDTLADDGEPQIEQQIEQEETKKKANELITQLKYYEELIIRLFFGVAPDLDQVIRLATEEKAKELKRIKNKKKKKILPPGKKSLILY